MDLVLAIGTGAGLAAAAGVRPFLPALLAGALASSDTGIDFDGTDWAFLESPAFLLAVLALLAFTVAMQRRARRDSPGGGTETTFDAALAGVSIGIGAALFAGVLADEGESIVIAVAAIPCALLGRVAIGELLDRAGSRLDPHARSALPVYADGISLVLAGAAILFGPLSFAALALLAFLLVRGRQRAGEKYAGLRILR